MDQDQENKREEAIRKAIKEFIEEQQRLHPEIYEKQKIDDKK